MRDILTRPGDGAGVGHQHLGGLLAAGPGAADGAGGHYGCYVEHGVEIPDESTITVADDEMAPIWSITPQAWAKWA